MIVKENNFAHKVGEKRHSKEYGWYFYFMITWRFLR